MKLTNKNVQLRRIVKSLFNIYYAIFFLSQDLAQNRCFHGALLRRAICSHIRSHICSHTCGVNTENYSMCARWIRDR